MTKKTRSTIAKKTSDSSPELNSPAEKPHRTPLWQALLLPVAAILIFFLLLEGSLALFGVKPTLKSEDPFVGFASNVPLFVAAPEAGAGGSQLLTTATNKLNFFNQQSFPRVKTANAYRIFTLGGSTTYGRPYDDNTSFSGWLRELLPEADRSKHWEVINAGGISYASYRVAHLMEELVNYQPDLFIIYTGHNEFLEERTYSNIKEIPPLIRATVSLLANTRTWAAMTNALQEMGVYPEAEKPERDKLSTEVVAILDRAVGLDQYTRDDPLRENILKHYRLSLERMVALAQSVDAQVIFVTPAASLNDCTPFKSEHSASLDPAARQRSTQLLASANAALQLQNWAEALSLLDAGVALDPRYAEIHYRRGQALLALKRFAEADAAFLLARDEDVCPLRALTPMRQIVAEVAAENGIKLVDYVDLLEKYTLEKRGFRSPGEELFLDHVHPTIEGHKILARALLQAMTDQGIVSPGSQWGELAVARVTAKIDARTDREAHGRALASLARVLIWAGKKEDAARLARQAQEKAGEYIQVAVDSASILATVAVLQGQPERAVQLLYAAIEKAPGAIELRLKLAQSLLAPPFMQLEQAAAQLLLVKQQLPQFDDPHRLFGLAMAKRGRMDVAYSSLMEALAQNPSNKDAQSLVAQVRPRLGGRIPASPPPSIALEIYPSRAPYQLTQFRQSGNGRPVPDGIEVEFHENGRLKRFLDMNQGQKNGLELMWDTSGKMISRVIYRQGKPDQE